MNLNTIVSLSLIVALSSKLPHINPSNFVKGLFCFFKVLASGHKLYFYNHYNEDKHRNDIEIDFIIISGDKTNVKISPIEVKSSKKYTTTSLEKFNLTFKKRISNSYIIHPKNLSIRDDGIICIPAYMTFCL